MPTKSWPRPPVIVDCFSGALYPGSVPLRDAGRKGETGVDMYGWGTPIPDQTVCKHGEGSCEACGTTNRRDVVHTTTGGRGAVGQLRGRR